MSAPGAGVRIEYRTPAGSFDTWEEAARRVEAMDMDPVLVIEIVRSPA